MDKHLVAYKRTPVWDSKTVPKTLTQKHNTKVGTWGKIKVLKGLLQYDALSGQDQLLDSRVYDATSDIPFVEPQAWHRVQPLTEDTEFFVEFFCREEDYFAKKYNYTPTHSEVVEALGIITEPCRVLDLGCGQGRNSLYLAKKGFDVTALDQNIASLEQLAAVAEAEDVCLQFGVYDIHEANINQTYDWIISTVVMMFLDPACIPVILQNMQEQTALGGYNLIVAAMDTEDFPCPMPFPFTFSEGELKDYYRDWELIKYNENVGELHKRDEEGNRIRMRFVTMLARK